MKVILNEKIEWKIASIQEGDLVIVQKQHDPEPRYYLVIKVDGSYRLFKINNSTVLIQCNDTIEGLFNSYSIHEHEIVGIYSSSSIEVSVNRRGR